MAEKTNLTFQKQSHGQAWDEVFQQISWWDSDKIQKAKVMVVGAGALGNEVLKNLALLNVGNILIVDFDTIEYSNLSRSVLFRESDCDRRKSEVAAERVKEINPNVKVQHIHGDIFIDVGLGVFREMDVVIGCLDNRIARLYINRHCFKMGKTWIDGAIENLNGQLVVYKPEVTCYECQLSTEEWGIIRYRLGCPDIARRNANFGRIPTTPISSSVIGALQVQEAMKVIYENEEESSAGSKLYYVGMKNSFDMLPVSGLKEDCESHAEYDTIAEANTLSCDSTIEQTLVWLKKYFSSAYVNILLEDEVVLEVTTQKTEKSHAIVMPRAHLTDDLVRKYQEEPGEELIITKSTSSVDEQFSDLTLTLREIGIPPLHIITVEAAEDIKFVELTGDKSFLNFQ